jgi:hypothetical protein
MDRMDHAACCGSALFIIGAHHFSSVMWVRMRVQNKVELEKSNVIISLSDRWDPAPGHHPASLMDAIEGSRRGLPTDANPLERLGTSL